MFLETHLRRCRQLSVIFAAVRAHARGCHSRYSRPRCANAPSRPDVGGDLVGRAFGLLRVLRIMPPVTVAQTPSIPMVDPQISDAIIAAATYGRSVPCADSCIAA